MFVDYYVKNNAEYARLSTSIRQGKKVSKTCSNLGRVLNREAGIFRSRERGVFTYDEKTGTYGKHDASYIPPVKGGAKEKLILDFGDAFILNEFIKNSGLDVAIDA
jgi:hypothetical protein